MNSNSRRHYFLCYTYKYMETKTNKNSSGKDRSGTKKYKILLVDDDKFLLNMYSLKFTASGHEITTALSGSEALDKIHDGYTPDILLCDLIMPVMNGIELLENIKKYHLLGSAAIVVLTNESESAQVTKAMSLGAHGYIVKATKIPTEVVDEVLKIAQEKGI